MPFPVSFLLFVAAQIHHSASWTNLTRDEYGKPETLFSLRNFLENDTVALSLLFNN
jgi:hypothetical protein